VTAQPYTTRDASATWQLHESSVTFLARLFDLHADAATGLLVSTRSAISCSLVLLRAQCSCARLRRCVGMKDMPRAPPVQGISATVPACSPMCAALHTRCTADARCASAMPTSTGFQVAVALCLSSQQLAPSHLTHHCRVTAACNPHVTAAIFHTHYFTGRRGAARGVQRAGRARRGTVAPRARS
jgi:hypothetical protein